MALQERRSRLFGPAFDPQSGAFPPPPECSPPGPSCFLGEKELRPGRDVRSRLVRRGRGIFAAVNRRNDLSTATTRIDVVTSAESNGSQLLCRSSPRYNGFDVSPRRSKCASLFGNSDRSKSFLHVRPMLDHAVDCSQPTWYPWKWIFHLLEDGRPRAVHARIWTAAAEKAVVISPPNLKIPSVRTPPGTEPDRALGTATSDWEITRLSRTDTLVQDPLPHPAVQHPLE